MPRRRISRDAVISAISLCLAFSVWPALAAAQEDTLRIGSVAVRSISPGVDTVDIYNVQNGARTLTRVSVVHRTHEQHQGRSVLRILAQDGSTKTDARLDPATLQLIRFERVAATDSTTFTLDGTCFSGWSDVPNKPRRAIQCVPAADRFGSGALDAMLISALPLRSGWSARVATFDAFGDITSYPLRAIRMDTIRVGTRDYAAWQVERIQGGSASRQGGGSAPQIEVKTTWWVSVATVRVLQERQTVTIQGTTRESLRVLRNP